MQNVTKLYSNTKWTDSVTSLHISDSVYLKFKFKANKETFGGPRHCILAPNCPLKIHYLGYYIQLGQSQTKSGKAGSDVLWHHSDPNDATLTSKMTSHWPSWRHTDPHDVTLTLMTSHCPSRRHTDPHDVTLPLMTSHCPHDVTLPPWHHTAPMTSHWPIK